MCAHRAGLQWHCEGFLFSVAEVVFSFPEMNLLKLVAVSADQTNQIQFPG